MTTMMMPVKRSRSLLDRLMSDPFDDFFGSDFASMQNITPTLMRTDITENDDSFDLAIDLPGFSKENIQADIKDGYLTIEAKTSNETEDKDENGTYVRKERFSGSCNRTFFVGEDIEDEDISAKFADGVLNISIPKKKEEPKLEEKKTIDIEG